MAVPREVLKTIHLDLEPVSRAHSKSLFQAVLDSRPIQKMIQELYASSKPVRECGIVLTETRSLRPRLFQTPGITWRHIAASTAMLGIYEQYRIDGKYYSDGGLLNALPLWAAAEMGATRIVAVNASKFIPPPGFPLMIKAARALGGWIGRVERHLEGGPEVILITPEEPLGKLLDGAKWREERIRRWIGRWKETIIKYHCFPANLLKWLQRSARLKKFNWRVRPGSDDVRARWLRPVSALSNEDLPTLDRPAKAISGRSIAGSWSSFWDA